MRLGREWQSLRRLHWQQLEWSEAGRWPLLLRCLVAGAVFSAALLAGHLVWVAPQQQALHSAQANEMQQLNDFRRLAVELAALEPLTDHARLLEQHMAALHQTQHSTTIPALIERIGGLADEHQLDIEALELQTDNAEIRHDALQLRLVGGYHAIAEFIVALVEMPVSLHELVLVRRGVSDAQPLLLTVRIKVWRVVQGAAETMPMEEG